MASTVVLGLALLGLLALIRHLLGVLREERAAHRREVAGLLQRIQAPQQATVEHTAKLGIEGAGSISPFDDDAWWEHHDKATVGDEG